MKQNNDFLTASDVDGPKMQRENMAPFLSALLYSQFAYPLLSFESRLAAAKLPFFLFIRRRTLKDQDELYAQGRTMPGRIVSFG